MSHGTFALSDHHLVAVGRPALMSLRAALLREGNDDAAAALREAGYAGGEQLWDAFAGWSLARTGHRPDALDLSAFQNAASEFFREIGWGSLAIDASRESVVTLESPEWWESEPGDSAAEPGCHFTTGLLAYFFGRVADAPLAVLEVECRSAGADRCRFLLGGPDVLRHVYDELERGGRWEEAV